MSKGTNRLEHFFRSEENPSRDRSQIWHSAVSWRGQRSRDVALRIGRRYFIDPMNPAKKKHRGRQCEVVEVDDGFQPSRVYVKFVDRRGGHGVVDVNDLVSDSSTKQEGQAAEPSAAAPAPAYLLTWNPSKWDWKNADRDVAATRSGKKPRTGTWSCGSRSTMPIGSRLYWVRVGTPVKGIFASGHTTSEPFRDSHFTLRGRAANYVRVQWDALMPPYSDEDVLPLDALSTPALRDVYWTPQGSGVEIPAEAARDLERLWAAHVGGEERTGAVRRPGLVAGAPSTSACKVPVEALGTPRFVVETPQQIREAERREQELVLAFRRHLESLGRKTGRAKYNCDGSLFFSDLVDESASILWEAKGDLRRESVRMAIGQLLDYRRFHDPEPQIGVLLPKAPTRSLRDLIKSVPLLLAHPLPGGRWMID